MRYHFLLLILFTGVLFGQNKRLESNDIRFYGPKFFCLEGTAFPDSLKLIEIGVDAESSIVAPDKNTQRPIVFYGTSITQGGCASRPGMVHTNIMSRKLDREVLNFGFSGNGTMDKSIAELISMIDAEIYIIECMPNMLISENVLERTIPLVDIMREKQPTTPIVFVGLFPTAYSFLNDELFDESKKLDNALKTEFQKMIDRGYDNLFYLDGSSALGDDYEGTVDSLHFTDLGFLRYANFLLAELKDNKLLD